MESKQTEKEKKATRNGGLEMATQRMERTRRETKKELWTWLLGIGKGEHWQTDRKYERERKKKREREREREKEQKQ
jgi:hypothetical protein